MSTLHPRHRAILRTLAYYDTFDFPLQVEEIWRWLYPEQPDDSAGVTVEMIKEDLRQEPLRSLVDNQGAFYCLRGRQSTIAQRAERTVRNEKKWRRAITVVKYLDVVPFLRMVAVVNTLAINNARPESDIDLLIVTDPGHIWSARMAVTGIVSMLGYRRHGDKITNRVCLSFYLTTNALNLEPLKRETDDPHFAFWASQAVPLMNRGETYQKYVAANAWVTKLMPNAWSWDWQDRLVPSNSALHSVSSLYQAFFTSPLGASMEIWARGQQLKRFEADTDSRSKQPTTDVVISDDVLKFHEADRRLEYRQRFHERLAALGL